MRIAGIIDESIVDGPGIRTTIFFQGCPHHCRGCQNPETFDFDGGYEITIEDLKNVLSDNKHCDGVTFSGGDPLASIDSSLAAARLVKEKFHLNLWVYTGYTFEEIVSLAEKDDRYKEILCLIDVLVDGPFIMERRDLTVLYRGSSNQRLIDVQKSLERKETVIVSTKQVTFA